MINYTGFGEFFQNRGEIAGINLLVPLPQGGGQDQRMPGHSRDCSGRLINACLRLKDFNFDSALRDEQGGEETDRAGANHRD